MSYGKVYHLRISKEADERLQKLHARLPGLPATAILKLILEDRLNEKPEELVETILKRIQGQ